MTKDSGHHDCYLGDPFDPRNELFSFLNDRCEGRQKFFDLCSRLAVFFLFIDLIEAAAQVLTLLP